MSLNNRHCYEINSITAMYGTTNFMTLLDYHIFKSIIFKRPSRYIFSRKHRIDFNKQSTNMTEVSHTVLLYSYIDVHMGLPL